MSIAAEYKSTIYIARRPTKYNKVQSPLLKEDKGLDFESYKKIELNTDSLNQLELRDVKKELITSKLVSFKHFSFLNKIFNSVFL